MKLTDWVHAIFGEPQPSPYQPMIDILTPKPRPQLRLVKEAPTREEFAAWRDDPTTRFVLQALETAETAQFDAWREASWHGGNADPEILNQLRIELVTRADAFAAIGATDYEGFCAWAGVEPDPLAEDEERA